MPKVSDDYLAARRRHILDCSREVFARNGFHATSMQDLLTASGLSAGAFYRYFDSKTAIIGAIAQAAAGDLVTAVARAAERADASIGDLVADALDAVGHRPDIDTVAPLIVQAWGEALRDPEFGDLLRAGMRETRTLMARLIEHNQAAGRLPADADADALLAMFFGLLPGYLLQRAVFGADGVTNPAQAIRAFWGSGLTHAEGLLEAGGHEHIGPG